MKNYNEKERSCEATFFSAGPYWHAYTSGKETPILFTGSDDLRFAMNVIAQAADKFPELRIIAFEVMNNHFHFVISGSESVIQAFFEFIRKRIFRSVPGIKYAKLTIKPIKDLHSLRNNIIYTNRNGYVADPITLRSVIRGEQDVIISHNFHWKRHIRTSTPEQDERCSEVVHLNFQETGE